MMIAHATLDDGEKLVVLGLERGNITRLTEGKPMQISAETHPGFPVPKVRIVIMFGETQEDLMGEVMPFINEETIVIAHDRKGKKP